MSSMSTYYPNFTAIYRQCHRIAYPLLLFVARLLQKLLPSCLLGLLHKFMGSKTQLFHGNRQHQ